MDKNIEDARREVLEILQVDYPKVKEGVYRLEVFMQRKSRKAVYELRDFLDHLAALSREDITVEEAKKHRYECRTHLRRCSVEPLEYQAEKSFVRLDRYARWYARIPLPFRDNPLSKPAFFQKMKEAKNHIVQGRLVKTEGQACEHMDKAFEIVMDLLEQVRPGRYRIQGILVGIGVFIAGVLATFAGICVTGWPKAP